MKRVIILFLVVLATMMAMAQPRLREPEHYIGVHGGALFSMALFNPSVDGATKWVDRTLLSGNGGLVYRYNAHKVCGFQVELNYMQRGWREKLDNENGVTVNYQRRLNYIEMPVLAHLYFGKKKVRGFFNVGPQIGVCFLESESGQKHPTKQEQYKPLDNKFDWGLAGGLGMLVRTTKAGTFQLEARFSYSFGDYFKNKATDYFQHSNPINLSVNLGYLWEIKKKTTTTTTTKTKTY